MGRAVAEQELRSPGSRQCLVSESQGDRACRPSDVGGGFSLPEIFRFLVNSGKQFCPTGMKGTIDSLQSAADRTHGGHDRGWS